MQMKGVIFDVDGTLLDTMPVWTHAGEHYLASLGVTAEPGLSEILFPMTVQMSAAYLRETYQLQKTEDEVCQGILSIMEGFYAEEARFKPGAEALLRQLHAAGIPMCIATSTDRYCIVSAMDRLGCTDLFTAILSCPDVGASKAEPVIFNEAARRMGTAPGETWVVEDGLYAVRTARRAGFRTVGVYDSVSEADQKALAAEADVYVRDLRDLPLGRHAALTIAGSDCSGGAGIQADLKTMLASGVYGMSVITALTAQNTVGVTDIQEVTPAFLAAQLDAVFTDIPPEAVKIGMVSAAPLIEVICEKLRQYGAKQIVVDPVMVATSGARLIADDAVGVLCEQLLPLATVITPNIPEAELLAEQPIRTATEMEQAARGIYRRYGCPVLCKGGHRVEDASDLLFDGTTCRWFRGVRIDNPNTHGTGCTLSSAIAARLAKGYTLPEAVAGAKTYLSGALGAMLDLGHGSGPMDHGFAIL